MAILALENDEVWKEIGGRFIIPVHDELIAEVPIENWERGRDRLAEVMQNAANFLPFPINCDVTVSLRWYGLEYPFEHQKPKSLDYNEMSESEIKWLQFHLFESGYELPVIKDEEGNKPEGEAAHGVNGVLFDGIDELVNDYIKRYGISREIFIECINTHVVGGISPANQTNIGGNK